MADAKQVVTLLRELVSRHAMGHCERYDADADAFYREKHFIAPGRSIPPAMNAGDAYERGRQEAWDAWTKARSEAWVGAMSGAADLLERLTTSLTVWTGRVEKLQKELGEQCDGCGYLPDFDYVDHVAIPSARNCPGCRYCAEVEIARLKTELTKLKSEQALDEGGR